MPPGVFRAPSRRVHFSPAPQMNVLNGSTRSPTLSFDHESLISRFPARIMSPAAFVYSVRSPELSKYSIDDGVIRRAVDESAL